MKLTVILLMALVAVAFCRDKSAALRHWLLAVSVVCVAMIPLLERAVPVLPLSLTISGPPLVTTRATTQGSVDSQVVVSLPGTTPPAGDSRMRTADVLRTGWTFGAIVSFLFLLTGLGRLKWLAAKARPITSGRWHDLADEIARQSGVQRQCLLLQSTHPSLLVTWGLMRPKIILPAAASEWTDTRARIVLAHEMAHIRRGDWIVQMCAELLRSMYWFNPVLWVVCRRLRLESEHACDDEIINGGVGPGDYASHLLDLAKTLNARRTWLPAPAMARPSSLERRVRAMLNDQINRRPPSAWTRAAVFAVIFAIVAGVAAAQSAFMTLSGTVVDPMNLPVAGATLVLDNPQRQSKYQISTNDAGAFEFIGLPAGEYVLEARAMGFRPLREAVTLKGANLQRRLSLQVGELQESITVLEARDKAPRVNTGYPWTPPDLSKCAASATGGRIVPPKKIRDLSPQYPTELEGTGTQGIVVMTARIGLDGYLTDIQVVGDAQPDFINAATVAVREWRFTSTLLNCTPIEPSVTITTNFKVPPPKP